jgi:signal peptidase II
VTDLSRRVSPFVIAFCILLLDYISKSFVRLHMALMDMLTVIPGYFNIVHAENPGIAFSLLAEARGFWRDALLIGFSAVVLIAISAFLIRDTQGSQSRMLRTGLGLILGGALGNLVDRVAHGTVTDFVEVHWAQHYFPAFNVADSAITIGACLLLLDMWRTRESGSQAAVAQR